MISFFAPCNPPKTTAQQKRFTRSGIAYDPASLKDARRTFEAILMPHQPNYPVKGPVSLGVTVTFPYLASDVSTKAKRDRKDMLWHTSRPDCSNWIKAFEDALVRLRFLEDDAQVVVLWVQKQRGPKPGILVEIDTVS